MGQPDGSKGSADIVYLPEAIRNGVKVLHNTRAYRIIMNKEKKIESIEVYNTITGKEDKVHGEVFVLAGGAVSTPRLLLNSRGKYSPDGVANTSKQVGKNLMIHPLAYIIGLFKEDLKSDQGSQGCCLMSQQFYRNNEAKGFSKGYSFQAIRGPQRIESYLFWNKMIKNLDDDKFEKLHNHTAHMTVITEDLPDKFNMVSYTSKKIIMVNIWQR